MRNKKRFILLAVLAATVLLLLQSCFVSFSDESNVLSAITDVSVVSKAESREQISSLPSESGIATDYNLTVTFLDVGQADCVIIKTPDNKYILIDSGNTASKQTVMNFLTKNGVTEIEYAFFTHPHEDHIGGAADILKNIKVKNVYMPDVTTNTKTFEKLLDALELHTDINVTKASAGQKVSLGEVQLEIISPYDKKYQSINYYSIALLLKYRSNTLLFMGDAESVNEEDMLNNKLYLKADLLKVGHHGSLSSSSKNFLAAVSPKYAVIMCGEGNSYGHPAEETLKRLESEKTEVFRTDKNGTVTAVCDGKTIVIKTAK